MTFIVTFGISGLAIILLIATKRLELKNERDFFILDVISKGNIHIRKLYHQVVHLYSEGKERMLFLIHKQLPIYYRKSHNKLLTFTEKKREQYFISMRDSKLLKKSDGISEFFKNISNIEKGNGEIHDIYEDDSLDDEKK
ncbi:MAG: hypothetical protein AAB586_00465 [Patescibacteria group bacterium]